MERQIIPDEDVVFPKGNDMLETMIQTQFNFHARMNPEFHIDGTMEDAEKLLVATARNIMMEGAELMDQLNWKEWKNNRSKVEWQQVKYEIADIFAFAMNAVIESGMTSEDLFNYYMRKAAVNVKRQEQGY